MSFHSSESSSGVTFSETISISCSNDKKSGIDYNKKLDIVLQEVDKLKISRSDSSDAMIYKKVIDKLKISRSNSSEAMIYKKKSDKKNWNIIKRIKK